MTAVSGGLFISIPNGCLISLRPASSDARQSTLAPTERAIALQTLIVKEMDITPAVNLA